jgi:hypothetical protein
MLLFFFPSIIHKEFMQIAEKTWSLKIVKIFKPRPTLILWYKSIEHFEKVSPNLTVKS